MSLPKKKDQQKKILSPSVIVHALTSIYNKLPTSCDNSGTLKEVTNTTNNFQDQVVPFCKRFFEIGDLEESIYVYCVVLLKKAVKIAENKYGCYKEDLLLLFSACLYTSIKMNMDVERWFIEDYSYVSNMSVVDIAEMDVFLVVDLLDFRLVISDEEFKTERKLLLELKSSKKQLLSN